MVQQNTNSASVLYTVQLNKVELGLFGGELVGGETSWWRDDRIKNIPFRLLEVRVSIEIQCGFI